MTQWYEELFVNFAKSYDKEMFTQGTIQETEFITNELGNQQGLHILDIGCGTGRHAIELAKKGFQVTGFDLSEYQLKRASEKAKDAGVEIDWHLKDARTFRFDTTFDAAIMICEGGFSLMETDEMNFQILKNAYHALNSGGKFIFTCLNALFALFNNITEFLEESSYNEEILQSNFDLLTFREHSVITAEDDDGNEKTLTCNERYYSPPEINWLLKSIGFKKVEIFGGQVGAFSRQQVSQNNFELLVIAEK